MNKQTVSTKNAPAAIGPYSQAVIAGDMAFTSGQIPIDPQTGEIPGGIEAQTKLALGNLKAVLAAAGADMGGVVKTTVFIADMNDFAAVNEVYASYFKSDPPARSCVQAARLPKDVLIEIEAVAVLRQGAPKARLV